MPEDTVVLRELQSEDLHKGYLELLGGTWEVGEVPAATFQERYQSIAANANHHILVLEDTAAGKVVGTATLLVEDKFIHVCGRVGHIEDVIVDPSCRGRKLGQRLVEALRDTAQQEGCYKIILDCSEANVPFYERCGLFKKSVMMAQYFNK